MSKKLTSNSSPVAQKELIFNGLNFWTDEDGKLRIKVPVQELPELNCSFINDEVREWSIENKINEMAYGTAYEAAYKAFIDSLENSSILEYLINHKEN